MGMGEVRVALLPKTVPSWIIKAQGILCDIMYNISTLIGHNFIRPPT